MTDALAAVQTWLPWEDYIKVLLACLLGALLGWERETENRPAGLRTLILVSMGSCLFTITSLELGLRGDPARVAAQVVTGIGFLGAGTIIRHGGRIRGITTAATIWGAAAVGMACGVGGRLYAVAGGVTLIMLFVNSLLPAVERRINEARREDEDNEPPTNLGL
jgi:putative Mg2+ transporter-C (MgtC) family protein